jgi:hypothetical protein
MRFHINHITYEFHWVRVKRFLSLSYVRRKPCTYHASRLALSPNGPKRVSTWASSSSNSIGWNKNYFLACGRFTEPVHLSCTYNNTVSKSTEMRFEFHLVRAKQSVSLWFVQHLPCTYLASRSALSENGPKWDSTWPTSPTSFIGCVCKMIYEPMVCSVQIVHLSCVKISTIFKQTKTSFHLSLIT